MGNESESFIILRSSIHTKESAAIFDPAIVEKRAEWPMSAQPKVVTAIEELAADELEIKN